MSQLLVRSDRQLDEVTLQRGHLAYGTGAGRSMVESARNVLGADLSDAELFDALAEGWSNGYVTIGAGGDSE